jgi:hypothetical protein
MDLVAAANGGSGKVGVALGNGNGTFQIAPFYAAGKQPESAAIADFNGDGKGDMVVANMGTNFVSVFLNNGDGTFHSAGGFTGLVGGGPGSLAIADFNGDGTNDLAFATGGTNVTILLGFTNGTWRPAANNYFAGTNCQSVVAGDFNGDGTNDLVAANFGTPSLPDGTVSFLYGNGNGTFRAPVHYFAGAHPIYVTAADFNGDGKLDLAVRYLNGFGVSVMLGNGDGTFQPPFGFDALNNSSMGALAFGDLNGDGKPDLALPNLATSISVLLNTCTAIGPGLSIIRGSSSFMISWPLSAGSFILESTMNFNPPNWQPVTEPLTTNNGQVQITPPLILPGRFFRLHQQ